MSHPSVKWFVLFAVTALVAVAWTTSLARERNGRPPNRPGNEIEKKSEVSPAKRAAWTTSRVIGSPEPPPPFKTQRVFEKLAFKNPTVLVTAPGSKRLFVCPLSAVTVAVTRTFRVLPPCLPIVLVSTIA